MSGAPLKAVQELLGHAFPTVAASPSVMPPERPVVGSNRGRNFASDGSVPRARDLHLRYEEIGANF
jgi:hypothetical protein